MCVAAFCGTAAAHDIPADFAAGVVVKPEGHVLHVDVRAPSVNITGGALPWFNGFFEFRESGSVLRDVQFVGESAGSLQFEYPIQSASSAFAIRTGIARGGVHTVTAVRFLPASGGVRAYEFLDDSGVVTLDPHWYQAAWLFVVLGFEHILSGPDHLLFLLCLVVPVRRFRKLIPVVTAFTVAHSITLIASASGLAPDGAWFPPLIEVLIAASIIYMAIENGFGTGNPHRRWMTAFGFGLVHGFGFSFVLHNTLQFAGGHLLASLVSFNVGVELGQIFALAVAIPVLNFAFGRFVSERMGTIVLSFAVAGTGFVWLFARLGRLWSVATQADLLRALILVVALGGGWWIASGIRERRKSN